MIFLVTAAFLFTTTTLPVQVLNADPGVKKGNKKVTQEALDCRNIQVNKVTTPKRKSKTHRSTSIQKTNSQNNLKIQGFKICAFYYNVSTTDILKSVHKHCREDFSYGKNITKPRNIKQLPRNFKTTKKSGQFKESSSIRFPKIQAISDLKKLISIQKSLNKSIVSLKVPNTKSKKILSTKKCINLPISTVTPTKVSVPRKTSRKVVKRLRASKRRLKKPINNKKRKPCKVLLSKYYTNTDKMGLSVDDFVFKPDIPINETNYPLENINKSDLYAQDTQLDKILSLGFTDPNIKSYIKFPSVSKIIEETISDKTRQILSNWRQKMIDELGEDGFYNHSEGLKVRGQEFHIAVRNAVLGRPADPNNSEVTQNSLKSLAWVLSHIHNPMAVESTIAHPQLGYRGVADCIAMFKNIPVIIDWKLSDKPKRDLKDTYDAPVQITAYIGALNHDPNYQWGVNHGLVAVAYANGDPCDVFLLAPKHCQIYWRHWLMRFDKFKDSDVGKRWMEKIRNYQNNYKRKSVYSGYNNYTARPDQYGGESGKGDRTGYRGKSVYSEYNSYTPRPNQYGGESGKGGRTGYGGKSKYHEGIGYAKKTKNPIFMAVV